MAAAARAAGLAAPPLVGFIGIGAMGSRMAARLLESGARVVVCDRSGAAVDALRRLGAGAAGSPAELAATPGLGAIVSMLPSAAAVREAYLDAGAGVLAAGADLRAALVCDSSTIDPATAAEVSDRVGAAALHPHAAEAAGRRSPRVVDAPVSGGVPGAQAGTLTFMVGGAPAAVGAATPLLLRMGRRIVHCGPPGSGCAAKLANNLCLAISMAGVAEALALGQRLGLDPRLLTDIFNSSSARCWSSDAYNPAPGVMPAVPAERGYRGGFSAALMLKDLDLAAAAAAHARAPAPMAAAARAVYGQLAGGDPTLDFSAIYEAVYGGRPAAPAREGEPAAAAR